MFVCKTTQQTERQSARGIHIAILVLVVLYRFHVIISVFILQFFGCAEF